MLYHARLIAVAIGLIQSLATAACFAQAPALGPRGQDWMSELTQRLPTSWGAWYLQGEVLFFDRNRPDRLITSFDGEFNQGLPAPAATTDMLKFGYEPGARITVGRQFGPAERFEVTYLGFFEWHKTAAVFDPGGELVSGLFMIGGNVSNELSYASELHSVEVNWRWFAAGTGMIEASGLTGFRYMKIDEFFATRMTDSSGLREDVAYRTENDLLGWQLGGELAIRATPRFRIGGKAKGAVFLNLSESTGSFFATDPNNGGVLQDTRTLRDNDFAAAIEAGLFAAWQVLPAVALRAGYDVLYVGGIALAPEQTLPAALVGGGKVDNGGSTVFHGPVAGVEVTW